MPSKRDFVSSSRREQTQPFRLTSRARPQGGRRSLTSWKRYGRALRWSANRQSVKRPQSPRKQTGHKRNGPAAHASNNRLDIAGHRYHSHREVGAVELYAAGVRPCRRITSAIAKGLGGPPAAALITAAISRK